MPKQNINIDRLEIRLRGVSPEVISSTAREFGRQLLAQLSATPDLGTQRIDRIDAGTLKVTGNSKSGELSSRMARHVAASIKSKLK